MTAAPETKPALAPWGIRPDGLGLDPTHMPRHLRAPHPEPAPKAMPPFMANAVAQPSDPGRMAGTGTPDHDPEWGPLDSHG